MAAICARAESPKRCGDAGWLHWLTDDPMSLHRRRTITIGPALVARNLGRLSEQYQAAVDLRRLQQLAGGLGLTVESLLRLRIGWASAEALAAAETKCRGSGAWSFPMTDQTGKVMGIRLRANDGGKFAVRGGKEGLFMPQGIVGGDVQVGPPESVLVVTEGPSDTEALLDLGFLTVGRPSCSGGVKLLVELVKQLSTSEVIIVADGDEPSLQGANTLALVLLCYVGAVRVVTPPAPHKDARAWLQAGGTRADLDAVIKAAQARRLAVRTGRALS
jgi:hypothetical protein